MGSYLPFQQNQPTVTNKIGASFQFRDGLIYRHIDHFNVWKWCQQALGLSGLLLGWTGFLQRKNKAAGIRIAIEIPSH
jgi:hypothetical protein